MGHFILLEVVNRRRSGTTSARAQIRELLMEEIVIDLNLIHLESVLGIILAKIQMLSGR